MGLVYPQILEGVMKAAIRLLFPALLAGIALSCSPEPSPRNLAEALAQARGEGKLLLLDFYRDT